MPPIADSQLNGGGSADATSSLLRTPKINDNSGDLSSHGSPETVDSNSTPVASGKAALTVSTNCSPGPLYGTPDLLDDVLNEDSGTLQELGPEDFGNNDREVPYASGATDLFRAIEEGRWVDAAKICEERPGQAGTWVKSSTANQGKNATFEWNVWKRLPIHEACRRQSPPSLISTLLDVNPSSASARTHFGELPLHLAIGCGSSAETIHLLLVSYPPAASVLDDAGRSPSDHLDERIEQDDREMIQSSLDRSIEAQQKVDNEWKKKAKRTEKKHADEVEKLERDHRKSLAVKDIALSELAREVQAGADRLTSAGDEADEREREIQRRAQAERGLAEQLRIAEEEVARLRKANRDLKKKVTDLDETVLKQEGTIERLNSRVEDLSGDLRKVCTMQDELVRDDVKKVESELVRLIHTQKNFLSRVRERSEVVRSILSERDVDVPLPSKPIVRTRGDTGYSSHTDSSGDEGTGGKGESGKRSPGRFKATQTPGTPRRREAPMGAVEKVNEEGAAQRAAEAATAHLKKEMKKAFEQ